ncbi:hypothetical protein D3C83_61100 [compost metagenome]
MVKRIADVYRLHTALIVDEAEDSDYAKTDWVLVTRNQALLERDDIASAAGVIPDIPGLPVWTDDYNNLFRILK